MLHTWRTNWSLLLILVLTACASLPPPEARLQSATQLTSASGWQRIDLVAGQFVLAGFVPMMQKPGDTLTIYIEGDGLAWTSSTDISSDPTPIHPTGLQMALHHTKGNAAYLARPCQFVDSAEARHCTNTWWTDRRFAPEVIEASNLAVDQLKQRFKAKQIVLVGYSGGGAVAALVAARRHDVAKLVTVAGNLDHVVWTKMHFISPLTGSLNPVDAWQSLLTIPQVHYIGSDDNIVPRVVTESFLNAFPENRRPTMRIIDGFNHACCWGDKWAEIYDRQ